MIRDRETSKMRNVTGIAIPLFEDQNLEDAFFRCIWLAAPSVPLEKQLEKGIEAFCLFFFEKRLILTFSDREFIGVKIR